MAGLQSTSSSMEYVSTGGSTPPLGTKTYRLAEPKDPMKQKMRQEAKKFSSESLWVLMSAATPISIPCFLDP